MKEMPTAKTL